MDINSIIPPRFNWPEHWEPIGSYAANLENELARELPLGHALAGRKVKAIARYASTDDVMFATDDPKQPIAIVHLTWSGCEESDCKWPWTDMYSSLQQAVAEWSPS